MQMLQLRTNKILIPRIARALEKYLYSFRDFQKSLNIKEWDEVYMVIQLTCSLVGPDDLE